MAHIFKPEDKAYRLRHTRMKALKDMIEMAVREMVKVKTEAPVAIRPEVINAKRDGDRYRAQSTGMSGRGW